MTRIGKSMLFACFLGAFVGTIHATTTTAATCSASDAQAAINSSSNGDTVQLPGPCSATWNSIVTVSNTHQITFNGQGASITWGSGGQLVIITGTSNNTLMTGFTFIGSFTNGGCPISISTAASPLTLTYRFYGNTLDDGNPAQQGTMFCNNGLGPGLIDHNTFTAHHGADEVIHNLGTGSPTDYSGWSVDVTPGGSDTLFIEDNTFTYGGSGGYFWGTSAIENYYGTTVTFRHNTLNDVQFDAHGSSPGACSGNGTENSTRWYEVYDNTYNVNGINQSNYTDFRGGSGVVFSNHMTGTNTAIGKIAFTEDCTSGGTYALNTQVGRGINQNTPSPAYAWGNDSSMPVSNGNTTYLEIGGTTGGCNTHNPCDVVDPASQPSALLRCESAADVAAGCPVSYAYTPYTYPHPLTQGPPPAPPTKLSAQVQ